MVPEISPAVVTCMNSTRPSASGSPLGVVQYVPSAAGGIIHVNVLGERLSKCKG